MGAGDEYHVRNFVGSGADGVAQTPRSPGEALCTLADAMVLCMSCAPRATRGLLCAHMLPQWRAALADPGNGHEMYKQVMVNGGLLRRMRALPMTMAVQLVDQWLPAAVEAIRRENGDLAACLAAYNQANQDQDNDIDIVDDDAEQDL